LFANKSQVNDVVNIFCTQLIIIRFDSRLPKKKNGSIELFIDLNAIYYHIRWLGDLGNEGKIWAGIRCHAQQQVLEMDSYDLKFIRYTGSTRTAVAVKDIQLTTDFELTKDQ